MILGIVVVYSLLAFNNVLFLSEHTSNYSLAMRETEAMFEEIKSSPTDTLITSYAGHIFDIIDKEGNVIGKGRVDIEDVSGSWNSTTAGWPKRSSFGAVVFDNKMWVMGGFNGSYLNDVWSSSDGASWNSATAGWSERRGFGVVVFDNKMWVMGGYDGSDYLNDVWCSHGAGWIKVLDNDPSDTDRWSPRANFGVVVFDNKMWVLGGYDGSYLNDVWCSCDGKNWSQVTTPSPFSARSNHASLVFDNKMWVLGGFNGSNYLNDVWSSSDGASWNSATAGWPKRSSFGAVVFDNKMWVMGGFNGSNYLNDVWYSSDGTNWNSATAGWPKRSSFGAVVFDNKMWVMGGYNGSYLNDVWYSSGYRRLFKIKITCSWQERGGRVIGEDKNLNGQLDTGEDTNGNGELDSPLQIVSYIANKEFPQRIFMIEK